MFSISPGMSAAQAGGYFSREDYYVGGDVQEGNSRWSGSGARVLGLEGPVCEEELRALCAGQDPASGARLVVAGHCRDRETGELVATHRAGNDATFSAPKSIGIAALLAVDGVRQAHQAAVAAVLGHMEKEYSLYRSPEGVQKGGAVIASFDHDTSRSADPQLHTHNLILNLVRTRDGEWKANWNRTIFQDQKSLGLLYRQELARELVANGFPIVFTDRSQMVFELEAVDPKLIVAFSTRRHVIELKVAEWREQGKFPGVPHGRLFEMAALDTRDKKRKMTREEVEKIVEKGFEHCGTTSLDVKREVERSREIALTHVPEPPELSAAEVVRRSARHLVDKEAVLDRARILDQAVLISGGRHGIRELTHALEEGGGEVVRLGTNGWGRVFYTTAGMRELEATNLETIRGLAPFKSVVSPGDLAAFLGKVEGELGVPLTAGQTKQIENELLGEAAVAATEGKAGAGKTFSVKIVERFNREVLRPQGKEHFTIDVAYTARAAQEMTQVSDRPAYTVDALLNAHARGEVALQRQDSGAPLLVVMGEKAPVGEGLQVVLRGDEASFVGARQGKHLLGIVRELQEGGVPVKLHLIGDTRQMQAIQAGDLFRQALALEKEGLADVAHLNEIRRQRDPELLEIAKTLNRENRLPGENASEALAALERRGGVVERERHEELVAAAVERYREEAGKPSHMVPGEGQSVLLIATTNADRKELNREIRKARVTAGEIGAGKTYRVLAPAPEGTTADRYRVGDQVVFSGYRGEDGRVERWGARLNTVGTVNGIDAEKNRVAVSYSFATKDRNGGRVTRTVSKELPAAEMAGRVTVYREEERNFAPGDRIVALKNDRDLGVQNGSLGTVARLDGERLIARFGAREVNIDPGRYRHLDHAYAVTIHKSQGATVEHAIWFAPVKDKEAGGKEPELMGHSFGRASYNALNVAVTRAQYGAHIFTNSLTGLRREVEHLDVKTSTLAPGVAAEGRAVPQVQPLLPVPEGAEHKVKEPPGAVRMPAAGRGLLPKLGALALLGKRLDELAKVAQPARHLPDDILPKLTRGIGPAKEVVQQFTRAPLKEIDHGFGK